MDKVLIVDSDLEFLDTLKEGLQKYPGQFEVLTASNGEEAVELLKKIRVSVLVTALDMPKMTGHELLAHMKKNRPQIPCIVMTDTKPPEITAETNRSVFRYLEKPFNFNKLATLIIEGLDCLDEGLFWKEHRK